MQIPNFNFSNFVFQSSKSVCHLCTPAGAIRVKSQKKGEIIGTVSDIPGVLIFSFCFLHSFLSTFYYENTYISYRFFVISNKMYVTICSKQKKKTFKKLVCSDFERNLPPCCPLPDLGPPGSIAAQAEDLRHHLHTRRPHRLLEKLGADRRRDHVDALGLAQDALRLRGLQVAQKAVPATETPARLLHLYRASHVKYKN